MTSHELAKKLLEGPDVVVCASDNDNEPREVAEIDYTSAYWDCKVNWISLAASEAPAVYLRP